MTAKRLHGGLTPSRSPQCDHSEDDTDFSVVLRYDGSSVFLVGRHCANRESAVESKVIQVKVKPNSRVSSFEEAEDGTWLAKLKSPPVDGKANEELIALLAKHFGCRKADVSIKSGASGRMKLVRIETE